MQLKGGREGGSADCDSGSLHVAGCNSSDAVMPSSCGDNAECKDFLCRCSSSYFSPTGTATDCISVSCKACILSYISSAVVCCHETQWQPMYQYVILEYELLGRLLFFDW